MHNLLPSSHALVISVGSQSVPKWQVLHAGSLRSVGAAQSALKAAVFTPQHSFSEARVHSCDAGHKEQKAVSPPWGAVAGRSTGHFQPWQTQENGPRLVCRCFTTRRDPGRLRQKGLPCPPPAFLNGPALSKSHCVSMRKIDCARHE